MKIKKTIAAAAALAMAASAVSAFTMSASAIEAGSTVIDFEDGDCSFVYMNDYDGGSTATISVEEYNGSKQLKVDPDNGALWSKIWFDLDSIMDRSNTTQITTIEMDVTVVPDGDGIVGWVAGTIGSAGGFDKDNIAASQANPAWSQSEIEIGGGAYDPGVAASGHGTKKFLLSSTRYTEEGTNPFFCFMLNIGSAADRAEDGAYTADYTIYIDNIVLSSKEGALPLGVTEAADDADAESGDAAETEAPVEETTAAPVEETTAAPVEVAAPAVDYSSVDGVVLSDEVGTSANWGQAVSIQTLKNDGGVLDPSVFESGKNVVVFYESDVAPELILQSWSGGAAWAQVPAIDSLSSDGVAVFSCDDMIAVYESDLNETLDCFYVGDRGSDLKVTKVMVVDASAGVVADDDEVVVVEEVPSVEEEVVVVTEAAVVETAPAVTTTTAATTGNTSALAIAGVMAAAGAVAFAVRKRK